VLEFCLIFINASITFNLLNKDNEHRFVKLSKNLQESIFAHKKKKGFNSTDVPLEFSFTYGELGEAFDAWRKKKLDLHEELADVAIYLYGLASILNIDLGKAIVEKMKKNKKREYHTVRGVLLKKNSRSG